MLYTITEHTPMYVIAEMIESIEQEASGAVGEREEPRWTFDKDASATVEEALGLIDVERLIDALLNVRHLPSGPKEWHMPFGQSAQSYRNACLLAEQIARQYARLSVNEGGPTVEHFVGDDCTEHDIDHWAALEAPVEPLDVERLARALPDSVLVPYTQWTRDGLAGIIHDRDLARLSVNEGGPTDET